MELQFRKAVKHGAKLRLAVCGPSGSGKTYTLLKLATELGNPVMDPKSWTQKRPFLRWWAALKMKESQCPERVRVTHPA